MIIIGGEQDPVERVRLEDRDDSVDQFAKNIVTVAVQDAVDVRVPDYIPWPTLLITPEDARGWYVYGATWDSQYLDIDYANRRVKLKKVGATEVSFVVEDADGTQHPVVWHLDILDKLTPLSITISPDIDTVEHINASWFITANVDGGDYPYTFRWYRDATVVRTRTTSPTDPTDKTDRLTFGALAWQDEGVYRVEALDRHGTLTASTTFRLTIEADPILFQGAAETIRRRINTAWSDSISFTGGKPPHTFLWKHDGANTAQTNQQINIASVKPADAGLYTLRVTDERNATAESPFGYTLQVLDRFVTIAGDGPTAESFLSNKTDTSVDFSIDRARRPSAGYVFGAKYIVGGSAATLGDLEQVGGNDAVVTLEYTSGTTYRFQTNGLGNTTFKLRNTDGTSEDLTVNAEVYALPVFTNTLSIPQLVGGVGYDVVATVKTPLTPETYQWQQKIGPNGAWTDLNGKTSLDFNGFRGANSMAENDTRYRLRAGNKFSDDHGYIYSNEVVRYFATFDGLALEIAAVTGFPATDPLILGGKYTFAANAVAGRSDAQNRAIDDTGTVITWAKGAGNTDAAITLTPSADKKSAVLTVGMAAKAGTGITVTETLTNNNGKTPVTATLQSAAKSIALPVVDVTATALILGTEVEVAQLTIPAQYKRGTGFKVVIEATDPSLLSFRFDTSTGKLYATGLKMSDAFHSNIVMYYNAPGNAGLLNIKTLFDTSIRRVLTMQAGISTAGDSITAFVDSQNKIR